MQTTKSMCPRSRRKTSDSFTIHQVTTSLTGATPRLTTQALIHLSRGKEVHRFIGMGGKMTPAQTFFWQTIELNKLKRSKI